MVDPGLSVHDSGEIQRYDGQPIQSVLKVRLFFRTQANCSAGDRNSPSVTLLIRGTGAVHVSG